MLVAEAALAGREKALRYDQVQAVVRGIAIWSKRFR
jgi:hypothetical protein